MACMCWSFPYLTKPQSGLTALQAIQQAHNLGTWALMNTSLHGGRNLLGAVELVLQSTYVLFPCCNVPSLCPKKGLTPKTACAKEA